MSAVAVAASIAWLALVTAVAMKWGNVKVILFEANNAEQKHTAEMRAKTSAQFKGSKLSEAHKENIRLAALRRGPRSAAVRTKISSRRGSCRVID